jgi:hypothetical protein
MDIMERKASACMLSGRWHQSGQVRDHATPPFRFDATCFDHVWPTPMPSELLLDEMRMK